MMRSFQSRERSHKLMNEPMISSCTERLLEIQRQLELELQYKRREENIRLEQELVSSVVMREQAEKRLLQEQSLLIQYLKQQLYELSVSNNQYNVLLKSIDELQDEYLQMGDRKISEQQNYKLLTIAAKNQYQEMLKLLPHVTNESTVKYQLVLKLRERNSITSKLLQQKSTFYQQLLFRHNQCQKVHTQRKQQIIELNRFISSTQQENKQIEQSYKSQTQQFESNKNRLRQLQQQIRHYSQSNNRLQHIHNAAQKDNLILKQQLEHRIQTMKQKQSILIELNQQKQHLNQKQQQQIDKLNLAIEQRNKTKDKLDSLLTNTQQIVSKLTQLSLQQQITDRQLNKLNLSLRKLNDIKSTIMKECYQKQQEILKQAYFIQQYININHQLIQEIQILIQQDQHKLSINNRFIRNYNSNQFQKSQYTHQISNSQFMNKLKSMLIVTKQQLKSIQLQHQSLIQHFHQYRIQ